MISENLMKNIAESMKEQARLKNEKDLVGAALMGERLDLWRAIKNEFTNNQIENKLEKLNDSQELSIIMKMREQRAKDLEEYAAAGRTESVEKIKRECAFLDNLIPKEPSDEDIKSAIEEVAAGRSLQMKDMKEVQAFVKSKYPSANGGKVTQIFRATFGL